MKRIFSILLMARFNFHDSPETKATKRMAEKARLLDRQEANLRELPGGSGV